MIMLIVNLTWLMHWNEMKCNENLENKFAMEYFLKPSLIIFELSEFFLKKTRR